jgi:hypothetical protein
MLVCLDPGEPETPLVPIGLKRGTPFLWNVALVEGVSVIAGHVVLQGDAKSVQGFGVRL